jgi:hypothetical protein
MTHKRMISKSECFYHIYNRIAGDPDEYPFGNEEKYKFLRIMNQLLLLHSPSVKLISHTLMSNHYHLCLAYDPSVKVSLATAQNCFFKYYQSRGKEKVWDDSNFERIVSRITSLSDFVGQLQKQFSGWMNHVSRVRKCHKVYRGHLWAERFKSIPITTAESLRRCIIYGAFNPLRAGLVENIGEYRFSSWGEYQQTGKHPHAENFAKYFLWDHHEAKSDKANLKEALSYMQQLVNERMEEECRLSPEEREKLWQESIENIGVFKVVTKRVKHWTLGIIIGSKVKNMELAADYYDHEKLEKRKFKEFKNETDTSIFSVFRNTIKQPKAPPS